MLQLIQSFLEKCKAVKKSILIVGDAIEDDYRIGVMERISPESPCPVFRETERKTIEGGAFNVDRQLGGWISNRSTGCSAITKDRPVKTRFMVNGLVVFRSDREGLLTDYEIEDARETIKADNGKYDILILSDYDKGTLDAAFIQWLVAWAKERKIPVIADHKRRPLHEWEGVDVLKMNYAESQGEGLRIKSGEMIVTMGAAFPWMLRSNGDFCLPPLRVPVKSVCGAGDCFTAFLALAIAHGFTIEQAAAIAHLAGGAYVQHEFNLPILPHELLAMVDPIEAKIMSAADCKASLEHLHAGKRIVFTNGVFDLLHAGHAKMLQWARAQGDVLVVGVNSDDSAAISKGWLPILDDHCRERALAALSSVDYVVSFDEGTPCELIKQIKPDILVKGPEYYLFRDRIPGQELVGHTMTAPVSNCLIHTKDIIQRIRG